MSAPDNLVDRDAAVFLHQEGSSPCIGALRAARGIWLEDMEGRRFIDLHGNTAHHVGHGHPRLIAALKQQLDELAFSPRRYTNRPAAELAERLTSRFKGGRSRLLLMPGGSEAIETAIRLATIATGRAGVIALEGSYHGHGMGSLTLSSSQIDKRLAHRIPGVFHVTPYWDEAAGGADAMLDAVAACLTAQEGRIGCLIAEPMRSNCHVPPLWLWPKISDLCAAHGVKLVFDEIPSGLGKTGKFFAHEHFGAVPDIVVLGKALGGGMLPLAAVIADGCMNIAPELAIGHYTHEKNPLLARAALTTLDIIEDEGLVDAAQAMGEVFTNLLDGRQAGAFRFSVRGLGLLRAVAFHGPETGAAALVSAARNAGLSATAKDDVSIGLSPPMTISRQETAEVAARLETAARLLSDQPLAA